jgi:hypothetical protein
LMLAALGVSKGKEAKTFPGNLCGRIG